MSDAYYLALILSLTTKDVRNSGLGDLANQYIQSEVIHIAGNRFQFGTGNVQPPLLIAPKGDIDQIVGQLYPEEEFPDLYEE